MATSKPKKYPEFPVLLADQIEVKVKSVSRSGAVALLYKTARTDMEMLDTYVGAMNWRVEYTEIKGNLYCTIFIRNEATGEWIGKQDCGTESRADGSGNEKKGEASDAFKRAGFRWGIGRELYTAPFTSLHVSTSKNQRGQWVLADPYERFSVSTIAYDENNHISYLAIVNKAGKTVFCTDQSKEQEPAPDKEQEPAPDKEQEPAPDKEQEPAPDKEQEPASPPPDTDTAGEAEADTLIKSKYMGMWKGLAATYGLENDALTKLREDLIERGKIKRKEFSKYSEAEFKKMLQLLEDELLGLGYNPRIDEEHVHSYQWGAQNAG